jgi:hypothetical protein
LVQFTEDETMRKKFTPKVPKVSLQTWVSATEYAEIEKVCMARQMSLSQVLREAAVLAVRKHAEKMEAA